MTTTLTREALLEKAKPIYQEVDVPGFGRVGIRQRSELKRLQRINQMFGDDGKVNQFHNDRRRAYMIVDHLMIDESTPMFSEADVEAIMETGSEQYDPLIAAINKFMEEIEPEKKDEGESDDSSGS